MSSNEHISFFRMPLYRWGAIISFLIAIAIIIVLAVPYYISSSYDSFVQTVPTFQLDKKDYSVGDTVTLTLELHGESHVRFHENIENTLHVWLRFRVPYEEKYTVPTSNGIQSEQIERRDSGMINTYKLEKNSPLVMSFHGYLLETEEMDAFVIVFPELNVKFVVQKEEYESALSLEIHGYLRPIQPAPGDSLEDYVGPINLSIR